ncbi:MAG: hypothetical protein ACYTFI_02330 [Planctomycetota bacterium]|jgi:hypothetical protein
MRYRTGPVLGLVICLVVGCGRVPVVDAPLPRIPSRGESGGDRVEAAGVLSWAPAGGRMYIDVESRPLREVLDAIERAGGHHIALADDTIGDMKVRLRLGGGHWRTLLKVIAHKYRLDVTESEGRDRTLVLARAPTVAFHLQDRPLREALEIIEGASGYRIVLADDTSGDTKVSVSMVGVPWRYALGKTAATCGLVVMEGEPGDRQLELTRPSELRGPPMRFVLEGTSMKAVVEAAGRAEAEKGGAGSRQSPAGRPKPKVE